MDARSISVALINLRQESLPQESLSQEDLASSVDRIRPVNPQVDGPLLQWL